MKDSLSGDHPAYVQLAVELGLTESATRMAASRLRCHYRELLRDEIAQTLSSRDDIESEIQHHFQAFAVR